MSYVLYTLTVSMAMAGMSGLFGDLMRAAGANDRGLFLCLILYLVSCLAC